ncbi:MAG: hypothetical protein JF564_07070 [Sphingomonas sp.]|nr:hypothetical protein [Sphingomonas sp.]
MRPTILVLAAALPTIAVAAPSPPLSWGRPGVSLATYRAESIGCAMRAYYTDVSDTNAAKNLVQGSRLIDTFAGAPGDALENARMIGTIVHGVHVEQGLKEVKAFQNGLLAKCLMEHGYHRFHLSEDQRRQLEKLKAGSDARHAYLHRLASDPAILSAQAEPDPPATAQP